MKQKILRQIDTKIKIAQGQIDVLKDRKENYKEESAYRYLKEYQKELEYLKQEIDYLEESTPVYFVTQPTMERELARADFYSVLFEGVYTESYEISTFGRMSTVFIRIVPILELYELE